jgi:outer membrane protein assembly factor BamB
MREWMFVTGNWYMTPPNLYAPYNDLAPDTAHILWSTPLTYGGLAGGNLGWHGFFCGDAYQGKWGSPVVLDGKLFYNTYSSSLFGGSPNNAIVAVDLHTGEELWRKEVATVSFGQAFYWSGQNAHHVYAYIWEEVSEFDYTTFASKTIWNAYNPFDGKWMYSIENPPSRGAMFGASSALIGTNGEILIYTVDLMAGTVSLWDSSTLGVGFEQGSWEPDGQTYNGTLGYVWTKPIDGNLSGSVVAVLEDRILGSTAGGLVSMDDAPIESWCISLAEGEEGTVMWENSWNPPPGQLGVGFEAADVDSGVFVLKTSETRQYYGFDLESGHNIWGPTDMQGQFDIYAMESNIAYGKLFSTGYDGTVYCYDVTTGDLDWKVVVEDPYSEILWGNNWPLHQAFITDGKIYVIHSEHSPIDPKPRGAPFLCIDIESGEVLWQISLRGTDWGGNPVIGDSIIAMYNTYDQQIYALGKGPSAMTVSIQDDVVSLGNSVLIKGTITDVSPGLTDVGLTARFPSGVPVVADEDMSAWMEYVYMQFPRPEASGVDIRLEMIDSNGVATEIGWTKSDSSGFFKVSWVH